MYCVLHDRVNSECIITSLVLRYFNVEAIFPYFFDPLMKPNQNPETVLWLIFILTAAWTCDWICNTVKLTYDLKCDDCVW